MIESTLEMSLGSSHMKLSVSSRMNGLDNAVIMELLSWKIKFSVNGRILLRKSSPKFYFKKCIKNVMKINLVKRCIVCLFNKFVRFFLDIVPHIIKSQ